VSRRIQTVTPVFYGGSKPPPYHKTGAYPSGILFEKYGFFAALGMTSTRQQLMLKKIPRFAEQSIVETRSYDKGG
jgi:hypothetical protein